MFVIRKQYQMIPTRIMAVTPLLFRLPPELLLRISSYISTVDLGSLRRTCKQIETCLFRDFAREFFTARRFMIEQVSLEALVGIANHKTLGPYLTGEQIWRKLSRSLSSVLLALEPPSLCTWASKTSEP
jgi:hypothetical protein